MQGAVAAPGSARRDAGHPASAPLAALPRFLRLDRVCAHTPGATRDDNRPIKTGRTLTDGPMRRLMRTMPVHTEPRRNPSIPFHRPPDAPRARRARRPVGLVRRLRP